MFPGSQRHRTWRNRRRSVQAREHSLRITKGPRSIRQAQERRLGATWHGRRNTNQAPTEPQTNHRADRLGQRCTQVRLLLRAQELRPVIAAQLTSSTGRSSGQPAANQGGPQWLGGTWPGIASCSPPAAGVGPADAGPRRTTAVRCEAIPDGRLRQPTGYPPLYAMGATELAHRREKAPTR